MLLVLLRASCLRRASCRRRRSWRGARLLGSNPLLAIDQRCQLQHFILTVCKGSTSAMAHCALLLLRSPPSQQHLPSSRQGARGRLRARCTKQQHSVQLPPIKHDSSPGSGKNMPSAHLLRCLPGDSTTLEPRGDQAL